jgi:hypothetical protein
MTNIKAKLTAAFKTLRNTHKYFARQNFWCCSSCGFYSASQALKAKPGKYKGVVFYHNQDADGLNDDEPGLHLAFGSDGSDEDSLKVGQTVAKVMAEAGLKVEWDGSIGTRVYVSL